MAGFSDDPCGWTPRAGFRRRVSGSRSIGSRARARTKIAEMDTNDDGRTDGPILPQERFETGTYELVFHAGDYLRTAGHAELAPFFLDVVPIRFGMAHEDH